MATSSICATGFSSSSSFHGSWGSSILGEHYTSFMQKPKMVRVGKPVRCQPMMMANVNEGKGLFAPAVSVTRHVIGKKLFNQLRGKAIAIHSQMIIEFCESIGAGQKQRQALIRLAYKNSEKLGFLA